MSEEANIRITKKTEQIGKTWEKGVVWDKPLIHTFYSLLKMRGNTPCTVLDVGAQTGCFSLLAKFFPSSTWLSFEPIKEAAQELEHNLLLNHISNVSVHNVAISSSNGFATLKLPTDVDKHWGFATLGNHPLRFSSYKERVVRCVCLDSFLQHQDVSKVDLIKIDTEGWEYAVLKGGENMIARDHPIILMEFNPVNMEQCGIKKEEILLFLKQHHYSYQFVSNEDILCIHEPIFR